MLRMEGARLLIAALFVVGSAGLRGKGKCKMVDAYPPTEKTLPEGENKVVEWVTLNLDEPASTRWDAIVAPRAAGIQRLIDVVTGILNLKNGSLAILDPIVKREFSAWPGDYGEEVKGIARATGIHPAELFVFQMAYEIWGLCTSVVAMDDQGEVWHGRNLDFGLFPAFDFKNMTWTLTEALRPLVINVDVQRGGKTLYKSTTYAGFAGVITGMRPGAFSVSVDSRFDNQFDKGLVKWILGDHSRHELTFTVRQALEDAAITNYSDAFAFLNSTEMIGPSYIILGGMDRDEGAVITKEQKTIDVNDLPRARKNGSYYVLETNYDNWKPAPFFDDRRSPARACMDQMGAAGLNGFEGLYNVLSAKPNTNKLTTFTTLMHVKTGKYEAYRQQCEGICSFW